MESLSLSKKNNNIVRDSFTHRFFFRLKILSKIEKIGKVRRHHSDLPYKEGEMAVNSSSTELFKVIGRFYFSRNTCLEIVS